MGGNHGAGVPAVRRATATASGDGRRERALHLQGHRQACAQGRVAAQQHARARGQGRGHHARHRRRLHAGHIRGVPGKRRGVRLSRCQ